MESRDAEEKIEHQRDQEENDGSQPGARLVKAGAMKEIFIGKKDQRKEEGGLFAEESSEGADQAQK
jgi:hypothetical protein